MLIFSQLFRSSKPRTRGFTLIELLVVMAIMAIVTTVLLVRQSKFDSSTLLRSLGYSVALSVRQAQVYGTSIFGTTTALINCTSNAYQNGACFAPGYGIYLDSSNPTSYTLYADLDNNGTYTSNAETVKVFTLGQGYSIATLCATTSGGVQFCSNGGGVTWLSILFRRPNPEACFTTNINSTACAIGSAAAYATSSIRIQSNSGDAGSTRSIYLNATGQISVGAAGT